MCEGGCPSNCLMRFELSTIIPHQVHSPYLNWLECHTIGLSRTLFPPSAAHTSYICLSSLSLAGKVSASSFFLSLLAPPCCNGECDETLISTFFFFFQAIYVFRVIYTRFCRKAHRSQWWIMSCDVVKWKSNVSLFVFFPQQRAFLLKLSV